MPGEPAHVDNTFEFVLEIPLHRAAPLFGPEGERCWAGPGWDPCFLHPCPGGDVQGAVFQVRNGARESVWVNTIFDLAAGRMQYVAFVPGAMVSIVDVRLTALAASATRVSVTYARTALHAQTNKDVEEMGERDRESGAVWQRDIESCLRMKGCE